MFTAALVDGLRTGAADANHDGHITVEEAYTYDRVRAAGAAQTPQRWAYKSEGTIVLARSPAGRVLERPALPEALRAALDSPLPGIRIAAAGELGTWLNSGDPARKQTALEQLREIADRDNPQVAAAARALPGTGRTVGVTDDSAAEVTGQGVHAKNAARPGAAHVREPRHQATPGEATTRAGAAGVPGSQPAAGGPALSPSSPSAQPTAGSASGIPSRPLPAIAMDGARVNALAFSPGGKVLAAGLGSKEAAVLLDLPTGQRPVTVLHPHTGPGHDGGVQSPWTPARPP